MTSSGTNFMVKIFISSFFMAVVIVGFATCGKALQQLEQDKFGTCKPVLDQSSCEALCHQQKLTEPRVQKHVGCICWQRSKMLKVISCAH